MKKLSALIAVAALITLGCEEEEEPPPEPPVIGEVTIECDDVEGQDYALVTEVGVTITDPERDLVESSIEGYINGLEMEGLTDPDADETYTWTPPAAWDPPMICRGEFTVVVRAEDATNLVTEETRRVQK